ncbi:MAG: hypothetical protein CBD97_02105 [Pelagibacteraceae bacterium TMED237]|nr:MAG: hypothetical protein CBD97_02105 [Pelagibacteraceae bacterium TMED237]
MSIKGGAKFFLDCTVISKGDIPILPIEISKIILSYDKKVFHCLFCNKILLTNKPYITIPSQNGYSIIQNCGICCFCIKKEI